MMDSVKGLLAIVWGLEHNGFGRGKNLSEQEANDMKSQIEELHSKQKISDWTKINLVRVIKYCNDIMEQLDNFRCFWCCRTTMRELLQGCDRILQFVVPIVCSFSAQIVTHPTIGCFNFFKSSWLNYYPVTHGRGGI